MNKINFINNSAPDLSEETLNQMQDNMEEVGVIVSPTEPTTNEKVWFKTDNNSIMVKNDNGEFEEFIKKEEDTDWILFNVESSFENFSWEPLAYKKIGKVVYIHGGGTLDTSISNNITKLPAGFLPRQNIQIPCLTNSSRTVINVVIDYDGTIKLLNGTSETSISFSINTSFVVR